MFFHPVLHTRTHPEHMEQLQGLPGIEDKLQEKKAIMSTASKGRRTILV